MITREHIMSAISGAAAQLVYPAEIKENLKVTELAHEFDSLDYLEFVMAIEERVGVHLREDGAPDFESATIGDLADWIESEVRKAGA